MPRSTAGAVMGRRRARSVAAALVTAIIAAGPLAAAPLQELTNALIHGGPLDGTPPDSFAWSPDAARLAFLQPASPGGRSLLRILEIGTGRVTALTTPDDGPDGLEVIAFTWSPASDRIVALSRGDLHVFTIGGGGQSSPRRLTRTESAEADPKFSPDGARIGFIRDGDLFVIGVDGSDEKRLTARDDEAILNGAVDWIYEEEFGLATAWWWSPGGGKIAYLQFDQREVPRYPLVDWSPVHPTVTWQRYPKAGDRNAVVRLGVVETHGPPPPAGRSVAPTRWIDTGGSPDVYLPRVAWTPDGARIALQRLDRDQTHLDLLLCDPVTGSVSRILEESDPHWINIGDDWRFLSRAGGKAGRFVWGSERDGFRHLYLHGPDGNSIGRLTKGRWVVSELEAVDERGGRILFTGNEGEPLEQHLYRVDLDGGGMTRLTRDPGWHDTWVAPDGSAWVDRHSSLDRPDTVRVVKADGTLVAVLDEGIGDQVATFRLGRAVFRTVTAADGTELPAVMTVPPDFDPARRYPVLIYVYGGPHAQIVRNAWLGSRGRGLWHHMMASRGYIIWSLDNRGSGNRGHAWETPLHRRMAEQELADQLEGVGWLKRQTYVDPDRIGIWGWSYGAYMTLHALFNAPDAFKAGVSVAPVADWKDYDTIYTERYMDHPQDNLEGYRKSSPIHYADRLKVPLLLVHGTADDNVHMQNSVQLLDALIRAVRPVEFLLYPGKDHGIKGNSARVHLYEAITRFLERNL